MKTPLTVWAALSCSWAQAHEGHGLPGAVHWHGSDAWGFVLALALVATPSTLRGVPPRPCWCWLRSWCAGCRR